MKKIKKFVRIFVKGNEQNLPKGKTDTYHATTKDGKKIGMFWDSEDETYSTMVWMRTIDYFLIDFESPIYLKIILKGKNERN